MCKDVKCPRCKGAQYIRQAYSRVICPACNGRGTITIDAARMNGERNEDHRDMVASVGR